MLFIFSLLFASSLLSFLLFQSSLLNSCHLKPLPYSHWYLLCPLSLPSSIISYSRPSHLCFLCLSYSTSFILLLYNSRSLLGYSSLVRVSYTTSSHYSFSSILTLYRPLYLLDSTHSLPSPSPPSYYSTLLVLFSFLPFRLPSSLL